MAAEDTNTRAWHMYGQRQLARAYAPPVPDQLTWTPREGDGPGAEVLSVTAGTTRNGGPHVRDKALRSKVS